MKIYNSHEYIRHMAAECVPDMRYDFTSDFYEWQASARGKLEELLGLPFESCEDNFSITGKVQGKEYAQIDFEFQSEEGYYVPCNLLIPKGTTQPLPTFICLQGHSTGKHISLGVKKFAGDEERIAGGRDFAVQAVNEGYCAIVLDQRYMGTAGQNKMWGGPACVEDNAALSAILMGRTAVGERVWDIMRVIDVVSTHLNEYVDADNIMCMGNSGGGTATFYASCMDARIKLSMPSCAVCTYDASIMAMHHCSCNFIPGIRRHFNMGDLGALIAPGKLVVVCGKEDPIFPYDGVQESFEQIKKVYDMLGKGEDCRLVTGQGGHQFYPADAWPVVRELLI